MHRTTTGRKGGTRLLFTPGLRLPSTHPIAIGECLSVEAWLVQPGPSGGILLLLPMFNLSRYTPTSGLLCPCASLVGSHTIVRPILFSSCGERRPAVAFERY